MAEIRFEVSGDLEAWVRTFRDIEDEAARACLPEWDAVGDVMFDRSQQFVHVITGRLKASGDMETRIENGECVMEIEYTAAHGIYEQRRGGEHDWLGRAYESTSDLFPKALASGWERIEWRH